MLRVPPTRDRRLSAVGREWCSPSGDTGVGCDAWLAAGDIACIFPGSSHGAVMGLHCRAGPGVRNCFVAPTAPVAWQGTGWRIA